MDSATVVNALNKHYQFLINNTGETYDPQLQHYVFNPQWVLANNRHFIASTRMEAQPNGDATTEGQSLEVIGAALTYIATGDEKWLQLAQNCFDAYLTYFYVEAQNPMPAAPAPWYCNWVVNGKEPVPADYPVDTYTPTHSGFKSVLLNYVNGQTQVPQGAPYFGEYLDLATFAFDGALAWDAVNASVKALFEDGSTNWDADGTQYDVDWIITWEGKKIGFDGEVRDVDSEGNPVIYPQSQYGTIQLQDTTVNGQHKTNFACRVPEDLGGTMIERNVPQHNRPCHVPVTINNMGNAADAEEWFGDAAYLMWRITGQFKYWLVWQCVLETCRLYANIDSQDRFFRQTTNASTPFTDGIAYYWTYPSDQAVTFGRDENGFITIDSQGGVKVTLEQQAIWFRVSPESIVRVTCGGVDSQQNALTITASLVLAPDKNDSAQQTTWAIPIPPTLSPTAIQHDIPITSLYQATNPATNEMYIVADPRIFVDQGNTTVQMVWAEDIFGSRTASVGEITMPDAESGCIIGFWLLNSEKANVQSLTYQSQDPFFVRLEDPETGAYYYQPMAASGGNWVTAEISAEKLERMEWAQENGWNVPDETPISSTTVSQITLEPQEETGAKVQVFCVNDIPPTFSADSAYTIYFNITLGGETSWQGSVGDCTIIDFNPASLNFCPGTIPFSNNPLPDAENFDAWRGLPYPGYQYPFIYTIDRVPGEWDTNLENMTEFLVESQNWYAQQFGALGPGASAYIWDRWDNLKYGPPNSWTMYHFGTDEAWSGYQPRAFCGAARAWYELVIQSKEPPSGLVSYTENWLTWLIEFTQNSGGVTPTYFPPDRLPEPDPDDFTGHMAGLWLAGACYAKLAGCQVKNLDWFIETVCEEIISNQVDMPGDQIMNGSWSPAVRADSGEGAASNGMFYGFWSGEILRGLSMYLMTKTLSPGESMYPENVDMASNYPQNFLNCPFAQNGDKTIPPYTATAAGNGNFSQQLGFPPETSKPLSNGGLPPNRLDFNGALNVLSQFIYWYQQGGILNYNANLNYEPGNEVFYNSIKYRALANNGPDSSTVVPGTDSGVWENVDAKVPAGAIVPFYNVALGGSDGRRPIFWGQSTADETWVLCDGGSDGSSGNVPNMIGKFIMGSNVAEAGQTGGSSSATISAANLPQHTHTITIGAAGNHTHTRGTMNITGSHGGVETDSTADGAFYLGEKGRGTGDGDWDNPRFMFDASRTWTGETSSNGSHTHSATCSSAGGSAAPTALSVLPPYFALAYFVKLP